LITSLCISVTSRELQFKIKGISMTAFSAEDVAEISAGGNHACNAKYLARMGKDFQFPTGLRLTNVAYSA
jgi:hypothetical protein